MVDTTRYIEWFEMAKRDLKGAEILFQYDGDFGLVCFHSQQSIEKLFKGYLIFKTGILQEGHSLVKLCKKAISFDDRFKEYLKDCAFVNAFYIETRYPAEETLEITEEEVIMCLDITKTIMKLIDIILEIEVNAQI